MPTEWGWAFGPSDTVLLLHCGRIVITFENMEAAKNWYWMCGIILRGMDKLGQIEQGYDAVAEAAKHLEVSSGKAH